MKIIVGILKILAKGWNVLCGALVLLFLVSEKFGWVKTNSHRVTTFYGPLKFLN